MDTRQKDLQQLRSEYRATRDPKIRRVIEQTGTKIANESRRVRSAREALLREVRRGRIENTKDIRSDIYENYGGKNKL